MKLKYIELSNFRGVSDTQEIPIDSFNVLVGKNDAGKSTVLKALSLFDNEKVFSPKDINANSNTASITLSYRLEKEIHPLFLSQRGLLELQKTFELDDKGKIVTKLYYRTFDYEEENLQSLFLKKETELNKIIEELKGEVVVSGRGNTNFNRIKEIERLTSVNKSQTTLPAQGLLKKLNELYEIELPKLNFFDSEKELDVTSTNFQSDFKYIISKFFDSHYKELDKVKEQLEESLSNEFSLISEFMKKNVSELEEIIPVSETTWSKAAKFDLNLKFNNEEYSVPVSHKGSGIRRLLMVAYFEYLASSQNVGNQIFAIEEPETFLHPEAQMVLLESLLSISKSSQVIITTHSPVFAGQALSNNCILVKKKVKSVHYRVDETTPSTIIKELGIKPENNLLNYKFVIFVEGRDDVHFLHSAFKSYFGKDLEDIRVLCSPGGGSNLKNMAEMEAMKSLSGSSDSYAVFVDGDNGDDSKQKEKDIINSSCQKDGAIFCQHSKKDIENFCPEHLIKDVVLEDLGGSQNPNHKLVQTIELEITDDTDVDKHMEDKWGIKNFKSKGMNIEVFKRMSTDDWSTADSNQEVYKFLNSIQSKFSN